jgi:NitT/TauT family transport system permease protein
LGETVGAELTAAPPESVAVTAAVALPRPKRRRDLRKVLIGMLPGVLSLLAGAAIWESVSALELVNPLFLPKLSLVLQNLGELVFSGGLLGHLVATASTMIIGLALATAVSVPVGVAAGSTRIINGILAPWINALNGVPRAITFMPLAIVIFGISQESRVSIVFISSSIPLIINVATGVRTADAHLLEMASAFNMSRLRGFATISLPSTVPNLFSGFRLAIGQALIAVVIAEMFASREGVGYLLARASAMYYTERVWAMILVLALLGVSVSALSGRLERRFDSWRTS